MIRLYTKTGCPYCDRKRQEFIDQEIEFEEINIYKVKGAKEDLLKITGGQRMVPVVVSGSDVDIAPDGG